MRLIDADALKDVLIDTFADDGLVEIGAYWQHQAVMEIIDDAPTIDLVRCEECVFQRLGFCRFWQEDITESDYCSYGERRTE